MFQVTTCRECVVKYRAFIIGSHTTSMCYHPVPKEWNEPEDSDNNDDDEELQHDRAEGCEEGKTVSLIFRWTYDSRREKKNGNNTWPSKYTSQSEATSRKTV